jgi:hypothetical protein
MRLWQTASTREYAQYNSSAQYHPDVLPNTRMQSDAAVRPQDYSDFEPQIWLDCPLDLAWRRG